MNNNYQSDTAGHKEQLVEETQHKLLIIVQKYCMWIHNHVCISRINAGEENEQLYIQLQLLSDFTIINTYISILLVIQFQEWGKSVLLI